jgi:hypothetical protein
MSSYKGFVSGGSSAGQKRVLSQVDSMGTVANVFATVRMANDCFLLVQTSRGNWGFAGGQVDKTDFSSWKAVCREFSEEVCSKLPFITGDMSGSTQVEPQKFHWPHKDGSISGFYCGKTRTSFQDLARNFSPSNEIIAICSVSIAELWQMVNKTHPTMILRPCAIESTRALLNALGFYE